MQRLTSTPHLIHIGYPKAASTLLQYWFEQHPEIAYRPGGFAGMYTVYDLIEAVLEDKEQVRCRVTSAEQLVSPWNASSYGSSNITDYHVASDAIEEVAKQLQGMFPDAMILIVTRSFEELLKSGFSQAVKEGAAITNEAFSAELSGQIEETTFFRYDRVIARYESLFPNKVMVLPYEMLADDHRKFLGKIEKTLDVSPLDPGKARLNTSLNDEQLYWYPRIAKFLYRIPIKPVRAVLHQFHRAMISKGLWKPVLVLLRALHGKQRADITMPGELSREFSRYTQQLSERQHFEDYRDRYMSKH